MSIFKELINSNDISIEKLLLLKAEIGMIEFNDKEDLNNVPNTFTKIANIELDIIAVDNSSKEIIVLDHDQTDFIMQYAAQNLHSFISGLACIEAFRNKCKENDELYDDFDQMEKVAKEASIQAGGEKYLNFYKCMFGI